MNVCSRVYNQATIDYAQGKYGHHSLRLPGNEKRSPKKRKDGKVSTKEWVSRSFYSKPQIDDKICPPAASNPKPSRDGANGEAAKKGPDHQAKSIQFEKVHQEHEGKPAVYFKQSLVYSQAQKFEFCLVGKFPGSRPSLAQIREWAAKEFKFKGDWSVTLLDHRHVFFKLDNKDDMLSVWARNRWLVKGHLMRVFRWTPIFHPSQGEPSFAAVWILLPSLPIVFFQEEFLCPIASLVGKVLAVDGPTRNLSRTNVARVCIEVNLLKDLPRQVWIGVEEGGFVQDVSYEKLPSYCLNCCQQGHSMSICKFSRKISQQERDSSSSLNNANLEVKEEQFSREKRARISISLQGKDENTQTCKGDSPEKQSNGLTFLEQRKNKGNGTSERRGGESSYVMPNGQSVSPKMLNTAPSGVIDVEEGRGPVSRVLLKTGKEKVVLDDKKGHKGKGHLKEGEAEKHGDESEKRILKSKHEDDGKQRKHVFVSMTDKNDKGSPGKRSPKRSKFSSNRQIFFWKKKTKNTQTIEAIFEDFGSLSLKRYNYSDISKITNGFVDILGSGGFGKVYKGKLPDGRLVAVKIPSNCKAAQDEFISEINTIGRTQHVNVVSLLGFCYDFSKPALIYKFMTNGTLHKFIFSEEQNTTSLRGSKKLYQIAVGIARGLEYLHHENILHRDIKPTNILLDEDYHPKISDFGLSRLLSEMSHISTYLAGTMGYMAPEYVISGKFSRPSDVFSYGIMLLEMAVGRRMNNPTAENSDEINLVEWVYKKLNQEKNRGLGGIAGLAEDEISRKMIIISLWCIDRDPAVRPSMTRVLEMLEGSIEDLKMPSNYTSPYAPSIFCGSPCSSVSDNADHEAVDVGELSSVESSLEGRRSFLGCAINTFSSLYVPSKEFIPERLCLCFYFFYTENVTCYLVNVMKM